MNSPYEVAIITGASSGIGEALACRMASEGVKVALLARRQDQLDRVAEQIRANGGTALAVVCDVSDEQSVFAAVKKVEDTFGAYDLVVANAGISSGITVKQFDLAALRRTYEVNLFGAMYLFAATLPLLRKNKKGQLVAISSIASYRGWPNFLGYSGSKSALNREMEALRNVVCRDNIGCTTIAPGFIETPLLSAVKSAQPFRMKLEPAVEKIWRAIRRKKVFYPFPWVLKFFIRIMHILPARAFDLVAKIYLKM